MAFGKAKRQALIGNDDNTSPDDGYWWYSPAAAAVKWAIIGAIFLIALLWFVGGYYHAQRRMKKGLHPLAYHRWLLPHSQRARFAPQHVYPQQGEYFDGYQMQPYPPPAYNPTYAPPPMYEPPDMPAKTNPSQAWGVQHQVPPGESSIANETDRPLPAEANPTAAPQSATTDAPPQHGKRSLMKRLYPFK